MRLAIPFRRAFTITELVVVLVVLTIAGAIVAPSLSGGSTTQLRQAASLLAADLDVARLESLTHADDPRVVVFDLEANSYHLAAASDPLTPVENAFNRQPYRVVFGRGRAAALGAVSFDSVDVAGDDDTLGFGVYGQLDQPAPARITLQADRARVTLTVDPDLGEAAIGPLR